jgi:outer membrane protein assembly factor BamA
MAVYAQTEGKTDTSFFIVKNILIKGNKITRDHIILRELSFKKNDTICISKEKEIFRKSKENLLNTSLFNFVTIDTIHSNAGVSDIMITVIERWYLWPLPFF